MIHKELNSIDGYKLHLNIFETKKPLGYIQIIHGMQEHKERYNDIALYLNNNGYTVITSDLRGHGITDNYSYFNDKEGYKLLLNDQKIITNYIKETYNQDKIIIIAHSMGTIITRNLLKTESKNYHKVILTGYPNPQKLVNLGLFLTKLLTNIKGPKYTSMLVENLSVGSFNKKIKNPKTNIDWLSYNESNIKTYQSDKLCGIPFTVSAYNDLFNLVKNMKKLNDYENINKDLQIYCLRGEDDPCTGYYKGEQESLNLLKKIFNNVTNKTYPNMRHEILNEENKEEVYKDILNFLNK